MLDGLKPYSNARRAVPNEPWLGAVPEHWSVARLKTVVENVADQTADAEKSERYIGLEHVESWTGRIRMANASAISGQVKRFHSGDVLFGKLRPYLAKVVRPAFDGVCTGELLVLRPSSPDAHGPYMEHLLRSAGFIHLVNSTTFGARMPRAEWAVVGTIGIPLPCIVNPPVQTGRK